jgi:hypothetical protein
MSESQATSIAAGVPLGYLALAYTGKRLPLQVLPSPAGYYIGTHDDEGPVSREAVEYFPTEEEAQIALADHAWTQRRHP